ncbi:MAG: ABC transporter permease [Myxococcota bacterium]
MNKAAFWALVRKDLRVFFTDRRAVIITILVPFALAAFMGAVTGGGGDHGTISVLLVDHDQSPLTAKIKANLAGDANLSLKEVAEPEARDLVKRGKASVAIVLPAGFAKEAPKSFFSGGRKPELSLLYDPSDTAELAMARGILIQHVMQAVSAEAFGGQGGLDAVHEMLGDLSAAEDMPAEQKHTLQTLLTSVLALNTSTRSSAPKLGPAESGGLSVPYTTREEAISAEGAVHYNSYSHSFAGMAVQFLLFLSVELGGAMLLERQRGLWRRLRAAPLSKATVLASRAVSGALLALFITAALFTGGRLLFGVRIDGSWPGFLLVAVAFALTSSSFGLLLATLADTPQAMRGGATFVVLVLTMLGGAWIPAFLFPAWMQKATLLAPTRWAMDGFDAMTWRGLGLDAALPAAGVLLGFAVLFGVLATLRFRWSTE